MILVVVNCLTKMMYCKPIKTVIDVANLTEIMNNMIIKYQGLLGSVISD